MAVLASNESGWIISHELFIKKTYRHTQVLNDINSYTLNPALFDIQIPFVKSKPKKTCDLSDVDIIKKVYEGLYDLFVALDLCSVNSEPGSNRLAKSTADSFYCELAKHPSSKFLGGNSSNSPLVTQIDGEYYLVPENSLFYCYDIANISEHFCGKKFDFILLDPPWWNKYIRRKRKKSYKHGYEMVYDKDLAQIPIELLLASDGLLGIWCTSAPSHISSVLNELLPAWNLEFVAQWFWLKITKQGKLICDFSDNLGKQPFERIIFGVKKNSKRKFDNPKDKMVLMSVPSAIHSHKPPLCVLLEKHLPEEPKCLELFARYLLPGWCSFGNEVLKLQHMSIYVKNNEEKS